jgi:hypothetical protein
MPLKNKFTNEKKIIKINGQHQMKPEVVIAAPSQCRVGCGVKRGSRKRDVVFVFRVRIAYFCTFQQSNPILQGPSPLAQVFAHSWNL